MKTTHSLATTSLALLLAALLQSHALGVPVTGLIEPETPQGQYMSLRVTIGDATTRFELTGPDYSFFAFGFNATTMQGYTIMVEGLDAARTVKEQNLAGVGDPGLPQAAQNLNLISATHDAANDLSTVIVERANSTGDPDDPDFSTSMTSIPMIWGYNSFATPEFPNGQLDYHGSNGRGFETLTFAPVPEPNALALGAIAATLAVARLRRRG
jgi:hypothetical protein